MSQGRSVPARGGIGQKGPQLQALTRLKRTLGVTLMRFGIMRVADLTQNEAFSAAC